MALIHQLRNSPRADLLSSDFYRHGCQYIPLPLGNIGIWNGEFELGPGDGSPPGWPTGWELYTYAGGTVDRQTGAGAYTGNYYMRGGQAGVGAGGYVISLRYIPVHTAEDYDLGASFRGQTVNSQISLGCACYDLNKAFLANVWTVVLALPGVAWVHYQTILGPAGVAFPANTRYVRVRCELQQNVALAADWAYLDHVEFFSRPW